MNLVDKNKFQLLRGGVPGNYEGCFDTVVETTVEVSEGMFVEHDVASNKYKLVAAKTAKPCYMVIEGNAKDASWAGNFTERAAVIRGNFQVQTTQFVVTGLAKGDSVTVIDGKLAKSLAPGDEVGYVLDLDAVEGTIVVDIF